MVAITLTIIGAAFLLGILAYAIDHILSTNGLMLILMNIISLVGLLVFAASTFTTVSNPPPSSEELTQTMDEVVNIAVGLLIGNIVSVAYTKTEQTARQF